MSSSNQTITEISESLTGYDEIAIESNFGLNVYGGDEGKSMVLMRAMAFVHFLREGMKNSEAKNAAMSLTAKQVSEFFAEEPDEVMPDQPVTEPGKDSSPLVSEPMVSPPSAS